MDNSKPRISRSVENWLRQHLIGVTTVLVKRHFASVRARKANLKAFKKTLKMSSINLATNEWSLEDEDVLIAPSLPTPNQTDELISSEGIKNLHSSGMFGQKSARRFDYSRNEITPRLCPFARSASICQFVHLHEN